MKLKIMNTQKAEKGTIELNVDEAVRPNLIKRAVEALLSKVRQPYGADPRAGFKHSTLISRRRRHYRGSYGMGISRVPRKVMSHSGTRFNWVGAQAPGTVGGRRAHPPKATKIWARKINKKENRKAINSAITATFDRGIVTNRGHEVPVSYPFALDNDFEKLTKTKDIIKALNTLGFEKDLERGQKGRRSLLIVTEDEKFGKACQNVPGIDVAKHNELNAYLLAPGSHPGRATLFTVNSIKRMNGEEVKAEPKPAPKPEAKKAPAKKAPAKEAAK